MTSFINNGRSVICELGTIIMKKLGKHLHRLAIATSVIGMMGCGDDVTITSDFNTVDLQQPVSDWTMVWNDEFDGTALDLTKWQHEVNCQGGGNNEQQCYTDSSDNSFVADGILNIVALPAAEGAEKPYTSARLNTKNQGDWKYGRFEIRAKMPSGQGSWPAIWMLPTDSVYGGWPHSGEIDIMEAVNLKVADADGNVENKIHGSLHYGKDYPNNSSSSKSYALPDDANPADDFHTYAIEWQEGEMRWYVDDYLYATQLKSEVRYNSKGEASGLSHKGWFTEYFSPATGQLETYWTTAPFDQSFHMILNLAVGGTWPENVNNLGVDETAFESGQNMQVDYVRVYQCSLDPETGKGCDTIRGGYKDENDALVIANPPVPVAPVAGGSENLTIFDGTSNPNWAIWDCCGGSEPGTVEDDERGAVAEFTIGGEPAVVGFISRQEFLTDPTGQPTPHDASNMGETGAIRFDMKVLSMPANSDSVWKIKIESNNATTAAEVDLVTNDDGVVPVVGEWQSYKFNLNALAALGLDLSGIDVIMIFPAWSTGEGAVYRVDNVSISADGAGESPNVVIFEDAENPQWPLWDCCGGSTPEVVTDDDAHGATAEFTIGGEPTVMGFVTRELFITAEETSPNPFDASEIVANGVIQFELKVLTQPSNADSTWMFKVESEEGTTAVELPLTGSTEGVAPATGEWQTYTFPLASLVDAGLDPSMIDVLMIFPAWATGNGAVYRVDNAKIYDPTASMNTTPPLVLYADAALEGWEIWDCCGGSTPENVTDDDSHGTVAEFVVGSTPTVMGLDADDDTVLDASAYLDGGVLQFELKVTSAPANADSVWTFKIESNATAEAVELPLTDFIEGVAPVVGEWQTYSYSIADLFDAGLDISAIDVFMVFPAWGTGDGAVYRIDNVMVGFPNTFASGGQTGGDSTGSESDSGADSTGDSAGGDTTSDDTATDGSSDTDADASDTTGGVSGSDDDTADETTTGASDAELVIFEDAANTNWALWDCCGGTNPNVIEDDAEHGNVARFTVGGTAAVLGFSTRTADLGDGAVTSPFDASGIEAKGVLQFDMKVVTAPVNTASTWMIKIESNGGNANGAPGTAVELALTDSAEGTAPVVGEWKTFTFTLAALKAAGLGLDKIDVVMIFPAWDTGDGAEYLIDNLKVHVPVGTPTAASDLSGLHIFDGTVNANWPAWDCCAGSSPATVTDADRGDVVEFSIGSTATVMGFTTRNDGSTGKYDASGIASNGVFQFDMKVISAPTNTASSWRVKLESDGGTADGATGTALEVALSSNDFEQAATVGEWKTFTFSLATLASGGLDLSGIDVVMIFPAWDTGDGAVYQLDNVVIGAPALTASE